ncbi:tripartite-type tricarboxylate transporter receptor subunit TctC [Cupriavidus gilardii J11]|uniref:Tripartite-type tricarboxylate transporter receptor subunit TctC n=1 Tax=Cupriavidus gilardii J11 TaxID=936133 RepID=A0A562B9N5_9BURK|nr:tripartite tricarboxylate transporter substrate-binding protein [Cupriavidus gilardii]TWG81853.1 tripartite-type tricarboxylate transporter receptor subunit TctC [Cupriavidus gilardii J11]
MKFPALARKLALAVALLAGAFPVLAQKLDGPLRLLVGYAPGGASDRAARIIGQALQEKYGMTVVVENKPGAGGRLAAQQLKHAGAADNVLMLGNPAVITVAPIVFKDNGYDADADFVPVSHVTSYDFAVVTGAQVPVREMSHLIAWLKANPDKAFFGVPATGSLPHFFALMLGERAGVKGDVVGYKGSAPLSTDLLGGQVPVGVDTLDTVLSLHRSGKLRILAVSGKARSPFARDIPTLKEAGIDLAADGWNTFFASRAMPADKTRMLAGAIQSVMADPAVRQRFVSVSMEPVSRSQEQTVAMLKAYKAQWQPVVRRSGFQQ